MADTHDSLQKEIVQRWNIPTDTGLMHHELLEALAKQVSRLIDSDINRLMTAMYTLDIDELRFADAMRLPGKDMVARAVAELILEREIQKMETRRQYEAERKKALEE
jgi:hypothetical protein